jgi:hypothetical protein
MTGAGPQEVRLRPGSYQVHSSKAGKPVPVDRDLAWITRGAKQVVKVRLEGEAPAAAKAAAITGPPAFVLLGGKGVAVGKFDTLIEAVRGSSDGDTIEVHGNGPFVTTQVIVLHSLTIRAAAGFRPVIRLSPDASDSRADLIHSNSRLVLEGLELWGTRLNDAREGAWTVIVMAMPGPLHIANCRLVRNGSHRCIQASPRLTRLTNCELLTGPSDDLAFEFEDQGRFTISNCILAGPILNTYGAPGVGSVSIQVTRSTWAAYHQAFNFNLTPPTRTDEDRQSAAVSLDVSRVVLHGMHSFVHVNRPASQSGAHAHSVEEAYTSLRRLLQWRGEYNASTPGQPLLTHRLSNQRWPEVTISDLDRWRQFWGSAERECIRGSVKFQGGDLLARAAAAPEQLTPEDFRLRPDSAGYRAGPDGEDLGADIDLVGPGPA